MGRLPVARSNLSHGRLRDSHPRTLGPPRLQRGPLPRRPRHPHQCPRPRHAIPGSPEPVLLAGRRRRVPSDSPRTDQRFQEEPRFVQLLHGAAHPGPGSQPLPGHGRGLQHGPPRRAGPRQPVGSRRHQSPRTAPRLLVSPTHHPAQPGQSGSGPRAMARHLPRRSSNSHTSGLSDDARGLHRRLPRSGHMVPRLH